MAERPGQVWDVVVVGAGTSGCPLAARLADAGRQVLLLEAGRDHPRPEDFPGDLRNAASLAATVPGHEANWSLTADLGERRPVPLPRGRVVGGSSAVNAGYFVRAPRADLDAWAAAGNDLWSYEEVLAAFRRLEDDRDLGSAAGHGAGGPVPVQRPAGPASPLAEAFAAASAELGIPAEPDKNGDSEPGYGPLPRNVVDGVRINTAMAYLTPQRRRAGLVVRGGVRVRRVLVERGSAVGVVTGAGVIRCAEVVLSAGAVGSPHLLLLSGIGPADQLRSHGIDVVVDLPGVGADATDHPGVHLRYRPAPGVARAGPPLHGALNTTAPGSAVPGDLELLPWLTPFGRLTGAAPDDDVLSVAVSLQQEDSRGRLALASGDPETQPLLDHGYLTEAADRRRLRAGVRLAADLLGTRALRRLVAERIGLPDAVVADDRSLDGWMATHLTSAVHLSGTARMGPESDPGAVVDRHLRVRGVAGLRVVDTSVLPTVPTRGPAATAVMLGERAAEIMTADRIR